MQLVNNIVDFDDLNHVVPHGSDLKILKLYKFMEEHFDDLVREKLVDFKKEDNKWILLQMIVTFIHKLSDEHLNEFFPDSDFKGVYKPTDPYLFVRILYHLGANKKQDRLKYSVNPNVLIYRILFMDEDDNQLLNGIINYLKITSKPELYSSNKEGRHLLPKEGETLEIPIPVDKKGEPYVEPNQNVIQKLSEELNIKITLEYIDDN